MTGVITERNRLAVGCAQPALRAENQKLFPSGLGRNPAHAGVLRHAKQIATGTVPEQLIAEWQTPGGAGGVGVDLVNFWGGIEHVVAGIHNLNRTSGCQETHRKQFNKPIFNHG